MKSIKIYNKKETFNKEHINILDMLVAKSRMLNIKKYCKIIILNKMKYTLKTVSQ